jgi:hypothetical protein
MYICVCLEHYVFKYIYVLHITLSTNTILRTQALLSTIAAIFTAKQMHFAR